MQLDVPVPRASLEPEWRADADGEVVRAEDGVEVAIRGDRQRLEQALGNLVDNALRHGGSEIRAHAFASLPLRLTRQGTDVLAGEADGVELLGIERWVGGTHLTPTRVWRWDELRSS